jgi:site-specific DNA-methyltransferase (adenine-specific)
VIKPGGVIVWVMNDATVNGNETGTSFKHAMHFKRIGLTLHDTMIWRHFCAFPGVNRYRPAWEYMFVFSKGKPTTFNPIMDRITTRGGDLVPAAVERQKDGTQIRPKRQYVANHFSARFNVWDIHSGAVNSTSDKGAYDHPAIFPDALARDHIVSWSNLGDIVLDPFSGSGTTAKMAKLNGRQFIGIEINPEYVELSRKRIEGCWPSNPCEERREKGGFGLMRNHVDQ